MKKNVIFIGLIILLQLSGCTKDDKPNLISAGIETRIKGNVNSINGESLSDVEIKIGEYVEISSGGNFLGSSPIHYDYLFKGFVQKINLQENGNFDFTFRTSGNGNFYKLFIGNYPEPSNGQGFVPFFEQKINDPLVTNLTQEANDMKIIGKEFVINHFLKKLYLCEVNLQFNLVNQYPIEPFHLLTYSTNNREITNFANPVIVKLFIDKANPQILILKRNRNNGIRQKAEYTFAASNSINTTNQNVIVNETDFVDY